MTHNEIYETCRRILPVILEGQQEGKRRYLFIVDKPAIVEAILSFGYGAVLISNDRELKEITEILNSHSADMYSNNVSIVPMGSHRVEEAVREALSGKGVLTDKSYTIYGRKKDYYEAHPYELEKPLENFIAGLENRKGVLKLNPDNGLIEANTAFNSYRDIAAHIVRENEIVLLEDALRIRGQGRCFELYTPEKNDSVLINALDNSSTFFRREVYKYIRELAPRREITTGVIPFLNCAYELRAGSMVEYTGDMYFTRCIPHNLNIDVECPEILEKFLEDITCGDSDTEDLLTEIVAYCLLDSNPWQKMFFIYGSGGNGKSTFFELLRWVLGADSMAYRTWSELSEPKGRYGIQDKQVVICDDEDGIFLREPSSIKLLTSGEPVTVKKLYSDEYTVVFRGKIISSGNSIPRTSDYSNGWLRRLVLIPFEGDFRAKPDIHLTEKLRTEEVAEAMIMLAIFRINKLLREGFTVPQRTWKLMKEYSRDNNHVIQFVQEMGDRFAGRDNAKALTVIYQTYYTNFCNDYGFKRLSYTIFARRLNAVEGMVSMRPRQSSTKLYYYEADELDEIDGAETEGE